MEHKRIVEYREIEQGDLPRSVKTVVAQAMGGFGREYTLSHLTAGYEPAGSCARWTDECWSVGFVARFDGCYHGQRYRDETKAREHFAAATTPIIEVKA